VSRLLVATTNAGKVAELRPLLAPLGWELLGLSDVGPQSVPREDGATFAENAAAKALHYARATGLDVLADDSGLEVDALGGAPGVHSARFAGPDATDAANNALLLERLAGVSERTARFRCSLCLVRDGRVAVAVDGVCEGRLLEAPRGLGGFGYDPLFVPEATDASGRSFAELERREKAALSHRGRAVAALVAALGAAEDAS